LDSSQFVDPLADFDQLNPLHPQALIVTGTTPKGRPCRLIDNTGLRLPAETLQALLTDLAQADLFGFRSLSANGGDTLNLDRRESSHIQIGDDLYRLIVYRYEARLELF
jgi:hypothetical protein